MCLAMIHDANLFLSRVAVQVQYVLELSCSLLLVLLTLIAICPHRSWLLLVEQLCPTGYEPNESYLIMALIQQDVKQLVRTGAAARFLTPDPLYCMYTVSVNDLTFSSSCLLATRMRQGGVCGWLSYRKEEEGDLSSRRLLEGAYGRRRRHRNLCKYKWSRGWSLRADSWGWNWSLRADSWGWNWSLRAYSRAWSWSWRAYSRAWIWSLRACNRGWIGSLRADSWGWSWSLRAYSRAWSWSWRA